MRVRSRPLSQSGAVAHPLPPLRHPRLLPPLRGRARAFHPAQPQRLFPLRRRLWRQAAAHPRHQGRLRRRRRRAPGQSHEKGRARRCGVEGGSGNPAGIAARARRSRPGLPLPGWRGFGEAEGLCEASGRRSRRGADSRRADCAARHSDLAPVAGPAELPHVRFSDHHVPAGRRHGQDRRGLRAARFRTGSAMARRSSRSGRTRAASRLRSRISRPAGRSGK